MQTPLHRKVALILMLALSLTMIACKRKPEDVDKWRKAKGGIEKITGWVKDKEQPMPVRKRAIEVLVEDNYSIKLPPMLEKIKDKATREQLADATVPAIEKMWKAQDMPKISKKVKEEGGQIRVSDSKSIKAKDAAYYMYPYVSDAQRAKLEAILADWLSTDHELRNKLGRTTLGQVLPRAGKKGMDGMMVWFESAKKPGSIAAQIKQHGDDKTKKEFAKKVLVVANKRHPKIGPELATIILETKDPVILPYLKRALEDSATPAGVWDDAMTALLRDHKAKASLTLQGIIKKQQGLRRWVASTRMIEQRGKSGIIQGANAFPLELDTYSKQADTGFFKESVVYCNTVKSVLAEKKQGTPEDSTKKLLASSRWPAQVLGLRCAEVHKLASLKPQVEALQESKQAIPGWDKETSVGDLAKEIAGKL